MRPIHEHLLRKWLAKATHCAGCGKPRERDMWRVSAWQAVCAECRESPEFRQRPFLSRVVNYRMREKANKRLLSPPSGDIPNVIRLSDSDGCGRLVPVSITEQRGISASMYIDEDGVMHITESA